MRYGYTNECPACKQLATSLRNVKVLHAHKCRDRIGDLIARDEDPRQRDIIPSMSSPEAEVQRPQVREDVAVNEPTVRVNETTTRVRNHQFAQIPCKSWRIFNFEFNSGRDEHG